MTRSLAVLQTAVRFGWLFAGIEMTCRIFDLWEISAALMEMLP